MEADLRRDTLPSPDLGEAACRVELAHPLSEESGVTAGSSSFAALSDDADSSPSPVQSTEWTNDKHSLYLRMLERSFVDQLNHSKRIHGGLLQEDVGVPYPSSGPPMENCASSDEFKVLQDGCWHRINFRRMKNLPDSHVAKRSWISQSVPGGSVYPLQCQDSLEQDSEGVHVSGSRTFSCGLANTSSQHAAHHICLQNTVGGTAEFTDQNFVDEDGKRCSAYSHMPKRVRRSSADGSSKDQVVPLGEFCKAGASVCRDACSDKQKGHQELLSEDPE